IAGGAITGVQMATYRILDDTKLDGTWSLSPSGSETRIPGTLSWTTDRAKLDLHDTFAPMRGHIYGDETVAFPAIYGITTKSQFVTVLNPVKSSSGVTFGQAGLRQRDSLIASWVIVGAHVQEGTLYTELYAQIPGLALWLCPNPISMNMEMDDKNNAIFMEYKVPTVTQEEHKVPEISSKFVWSIGRSFGGDRITDVTIKTFGSLIIKSTEPHTIEWFIDQLGKATTLLAFIAGSPMGPESITARIAESDNKVDVLVALRKGESCPFENLHDFFMTRSSMSATLEHVFTRWFARYPTVEMPAQLALSVLSSKGLWLHVEFLSLMQALEGLHRETMPGLYVEASRYESVERTLTEAIPDTVGPDHRRSLTARIHYGNEFSLGKRLNDLSQRLELPLRKFILGSDLVPRQWIETRNYYTHWDSNSKDTVLTSGNMHHACLRLRLLLRALYLDFVGIPQAAIAKSLVNACRDSQYLVQLNNAEVRKRNPGVDVKPLMTIS